MSAAYEFSAKAEIVADAALYEGDFGTRVVELQKLLNLNGANLIVDGFFGPMTRAAVIRFQLQQRLVPDGVMSPVVWRELRQHKPSISSEDR